MKAAAPAPVKPPSMIWRCGCGIFNFAHRDDCAGCGEKKPVEKVKK